MSAQERVGLRKYNNHSASTIPVDRLPVSRLLLRTPEDRLWRHWLWRVRRCLAGERAALLVEIIRLTGYTPYHIKPHNDQLGFIWGVMRYIAYYRVSTKKQGKSGLGLEAQQKIIAEFVASSGGELVAEYTEVESGKVDDRPKLVAAMKQADLVGGRLLVAKLDRLSRDLNFITSLQKTKVDFSICDLPGCDNFTIHLYGALAQKERELISARTKAGLAAAKARGQKLGTNNLKPELAQEASAKGIATIKANADSFAAKVATVIHDMHGRTKSLSAVARELNALNIQTARGKQWTPTAVKNVLARL